MASVQVACVEVATATTAAGTATATLCTAAAVSSCMSMTAELTAPGLAPEVKDFLRRNLASFKFAFTVRWGLGPPREQQHRGVATEDVAACGGVVVLLHSASPLGVHMRWQDGVVAGGQPGGAPGGAAVGRQ